MFRRHIMRTLWAKVLGILTAVWLLPAKAFAAGGGGEAIVIVADTRRFTGWEAWWTNLYNESHLWFTVVTIILIPVIGVILGVITDFFMAHVGINLKSRDLAEH
jgi:hypothetical protein